MYELNVGDLVITRDYKKKINIYLVSGNIENEPDIVCVLSVFGSFRRSWLMREQHKYFKVKVQRVKK